MPVPPFTASLGIVACAFAAWCANPGGGNPQAARTDPARTERERMVADQIESRDVRDPRVLAAMREVPRHLFVPGEGQAEAYGDHPLPIGHGQTISQPYIVALMTELARPSPTDRALEIGTGSGYQAAVLSRLVSHVYSVELNEPLHQQAKERLTRLGYTNVTAILGDGYQGWAAAAPYDIVIVTAAPDTVPERLVAQLKPGGRLVIPVGTYSQDLQVIEKDAEGRVRARSIVPVMFVPLVKEKK